jgi:hypothetical protein
MRSTRLLLAACASVALATLACSNNQPTTVTSDASLPAADASNAPCTSVGGTCIPYTTTCPVLQQNTGLCGDSVMICCLPADDAGPFFPEDSGAGEDAGEPPADASPVSGD